MESVKGIAGDCLCFESTTPTMKENLQPKLEVQSELNQEPEPEEEATPLSSALVLSEKVCLEEKSNGIFIELSSRLIAADVLLELALKTREEILKNRNNKKGALGVG